MNIHMIQVKTARGSEVLVRIRNPHGTREWNGPWHDADPRWKEVIFD